MAFQMIPPRVSSSPPPLDSLPSVACPGDDDEDEEFGSFATHNSFDITGLSDKLPPTPDSSPARFPNQAASGGSSLRVPNNGAQSAKNKESAKYGTERQEVEPSSCSAMRETSNICSPNSFRTSDINGDIGATLEAEDDGDFCDFAQYGHSDPTSNQVNDAGVASGGFLSSQYPIEVSHNADSANSFSVIATPPPLDQIADSIVVDDEFSRISPNPPHGLEEDEFGDLEVPNPPQDDGEDEFGDFSAFAADTVTTSCTLPVKVVECDNIKGETLEVDVCAETAKNVEHPNSNRDQITNFSGSGMPYLQENNRDGVDSKSNPNCDGQNKSENASICTDSKPDDSERTCNLDSKEQENQNKMDVNLEENMCKTEVGNVQLITHQLHVEIEEKDEPLTAASSTIAQSIGEAENEKKAEETEQNCAEFGEFGSGESEASACNHSLNNSIRTVGNSVTETHITDSDVCKVISKEEGVNSKNSVNNNDDNVSSDGNQQDDGDDFGDFSKANDEENDDDDDLDFNDLREQVRNGTFGMEESEETADDFGKFYEYGSGHSIPDSRYVDSKEICKSDSSKAAKIDSEEPDDFGDFATVVSDDDFGDFATTDWQGATKVPEEGSDQEGEFGNFTSQQTPEVVSKNARFSWQDSSAQNDNPVLRKLENLVFKWIPREPNQTSRLTGNQETPFSPTLFQSVEDDAFVWRQLENLEASAALTLSWGSMQAQTLYLSSVNVDARNIVSKSAMITLFGQKWSSSVPLFAQTLSFSPLTPAKPIEGNGVNPGGSSAGSVTPPVLVSSTSPKLITAAKEGDELRVPVVEERRSEEQIPPAKFDWTSSGLINPLEGPAYNSSLFDMDLLLSNSNIGKGATNAILASLEREFLGEGGEKGANNRLKGPTVPSPLVQQILGSGLNSSSSAVTPLQSLSIGAREVVETLPDISFMRSRVLMFPIRGDK